MKVWLLLLSFLSTVTWAGERELGRRVLGKINGRELTWVETEVSDDEEHSFSRYDLEYTVGRKAHVVQVSKILSPEQKVLKAAIRGNKLVLTLGQEHGFDGKKASVVTFNFDGTNDTLTPVTQRNSHIDLAPWVKAKKLLENDEWRDSAQLIRQLRLKGDVDQTFTIATFGEMTPLLLTRLPADTFVSRVKIWIESWVYPVGKPVDLEKALESRAWYGDMPATSKILFESQIVLWEKLAKYLQEGNESQMAQQILRWVVEVSPGFSEAHSWLAAAYRKNKWPELAAKHDYIYEQQARVFHGQKANPNKPGLPRVLIEETEKWLKFKDTKVCVDFQNLKLSPYAINGEPRTFTIPKSACLRAIPLKQEFPVAVDVTKGTVNSGVLNGAHRFDEIVCEAGHPFLDTPTRFFCTQEKDQAVRGLPLKAHTLTTLDHHHRPIGFTLTEDTRIRGHKMMKDHPVVLERTQGQDHTLEFTLAEVWDLDNFKIPVGTKVSLNANSLPLPEDFDEVAYTIDLPAPTIIEEVTFRGRVELAPGFKLIAGELAKPWSGSSGEYCAAGKWVVFMSDVHHFRCGQRSR